MKNLLILGAGTAGTIMANRLRKKLPADKWTITVIDQYPKHYYQPGFLFMPFGIYSEKDVIKPKRKFIRRDVRYVEAKIDHIDQNTLAAVKEKLFVPSAAWSFMHQAWGLRKICAVKAKGRLSPKWSQFKNRNKRRRYEKSALHSCRTNDGDFAGGVCNRARYHGPSGVLSCRVADSNRCAHSKPC
jgi:hypothetical protein